MPAKKKPDPNIISNLDPTGITIDNRWKVGKLLGSGACGSVHEVLPLRGTTSTESSSSRYVAKIASLPVSRGQVKKKKSAMERNADLLYYENSLYRNVLNEMRGIHIPDVPFDATEPAGLTDVEVNNDSEHSSNHFRVLVMERMHSSFPELVHIWTKEIDGNQRTSIKVCLGSVGARLVEIIKAFHDAKHLFVDVKPENFMLSSTFSSWKRSSMKMRMDLLARSIRAIDLGLMECYRQISSSNSKIRPNEYPNAPVVGTPNYASLNVLSGHTVSRRDDLEAVGYVLLELFLQLIDEIDHTNSNHQSKPHVLPWAKGKSDSEVHKLKFEAIEGKKSSIFDTIKSRGYSEVSTTMKKYFKIVRNLSYTEKPNYEELITIMSQLDGVIISEPKQKINASSKRRKRSGRIEYLDEVEENAEQQAGDINEIDNYQSGVDSLNQKAGKCKRAVDTRPSTRSRKLNKNVNVSLKSDTYSEAPHKEKFERTFNQKELDNDIFLEVPENNYDENSLLDMEVEVIDLSGFKSKENVGSESKSFDDDESFKSCRTSELKEEYMDCENSDTAMPVGNNNVYIKPSVTSPPPKREPRNITNTINKTSTQKRDTATSFVKETKNTSSLSIVFEEGPHSGESFTIADGVYTIGKKPSKARSKLANSYSTPKDTEMASSHIKLALSKTKGGLSLRITDLKSESGSFINDRMIPLGGGRQAFIGDRIRIGSSILRIKKC